ncbi:MAG: aminotransferase class III-fold pyridoxal phosphate-dependent enzyme [SAR324 cluster bacterium]|nr:aminotransferase class III-fold pyridoxal phosphate-dependent enzyme [SAR324 cluster bacterium]MBF0352086.1 aminotransferase class III-fold pyridoxal phosphate-dependent enzyme [SAR324 cluster bacterium]
MKHSESHVFFSKKPRPFAERGEGVYIYDTDGKRYLDGIGGTHVVSIGHGVPEIAEAMAEQSRKIAFVNKMQFAHESQEQLADVIIDMAPEGMDRVAFATGGSVANELALLIARHYHIEQGNSQKWKIIGRWHSYHGRTVAALSMSGSVFVQRDVMAPYELNFPHIHAPHCYQCPFQLTHPDCALACADELATTIEKEGPDTVAAFIAEPIIGGAGSGIVPPPGYYERIREICDQYDVLFISEEVVTGFGRTGKNFGIEHWNAIPDIITGAKGLSSGYAPIGATIVHKRIWELFVKNNKDTIPAWVTYSGHPVSCATALAVQNYIVRHNLIERCASMGLYLKKELEKLAGREPLIGNVRGKGLLIGIEFVQDQTTHQPFPRSMKLTEQVVQKALDNGLILRGRFGTGTGKDGDHILISPPFVITESECDELVATLESSIAQVKRSMTGIA